MLVQVSEYAVVVQVAGAGCAHAVQLSMGELRAFHVHLNLLCSRGRRRGQREGGGKEKKGKTNNLIVTTNYTTNYVQYICGI